MRNIIKILIIFLTSLNISCSEVFDYSNYVIDFENNDKECNLKNENRLIEEEPGAQIRIAITGDTHRIYDEFDRFVNGVNELDKYYPIDFAIHVGDIADFGLPQQYLWGNSYLKKLNIPYFVVVGNHDLVGNGYQAYLEMYGNYNFSFIYNEIKFVFINTNSREFNFNGNVPDINWLRSQLSPSSNYKYAIVIFHVPPTDADFDQELTNEFQKALSENNNVLFTLHGHAHHYERYVPFSDSITYINVFGVQYNKFNVITISDDTFDVEIFDF